MPKEHADMIAPRRGGGDCRRWTTLGAFAGVVLLAAACGSVNAPTLSLPAVPLLKPAEKAEAPIRAKRMEFERFEVDWDGMTPLASRPKAKVREQLLTSIERECPRYALVNEGEKTEETDVQNSAGVQQNAKIYRNYYWVRYRCPGDGGR